MRDRDDPWGESEAYRRVPRCECGVRLVDGRCLACDMTLLEAQVMEAVQQIHEVTGVPVAELVERLGLDLGE